MRHRPHLDHHLDKHPRSQDDRFAASPWMSRAVNSGRHRACGTGLLARSPQRSGHHQASSLVTCGWGGPWRGRRPTGRGARTGGSPGGRVGGRSAPSGAAPRPEGSRLDGGPPPPAPVDSSRVGRGAAPARSLRGWCVREGFSIITPERPLVIPGSASTRAAVLRIPQRGGRSCE